MNFEAARKFILNKLKKELDQDLFYHSYSHTLDVFASTQEIAEQEGIDGEEFTLLKTAALYHDSGFLTTYQEHEKVGCELVRQVLPNFDYTSDQIERICGMIMATKVPQNPQNHLEKIICDADLYYLGRDDFFPVGRNLFREFLHHGVVQSEESWNELQIKFLSNHHYFTETAQRLRAPRKAEHLAQIQRMSRVQ